MPELHELPQHCAVCRRSIDTVGERLTMTALGKPLFNVHKEPCARRLYAGVNMLTALAVKGLHTTMVRKTPTLVKVIEGAYRLKSG